MAGGLTFLSRLRLENARLRLLAILRVLASDNLLGEFFVELTLIDGAVFAERRRQ